MIKNKETESMWIGPGHSIRMSVRETSVNLDNNSWERKGVSLYYIHSYETQE